MAAYCVSYQGHTDLTHIFQDILLTMANVHTRVERYTSDQLLYQRWTGHTLH